MGLRPVLPKDIPGMVFRETGQRTQTYRDRILCAGNARYRERGALHSAYWNRDEVKVTLNLARVADCE